MMIKRETLKQSRLLMTLTKKILKRKKRRKINTGNQHFLLFPPTMFSAHPNTKFIFFSIPVVVCKHFQWDKSKFVVWYRLNGYLKIFRTQIKSSRVDVFLQELDGSQRIHLKSLRNLVDSGKPQITEREMFSSLE